MRLLSDGYLVSDARCRPCDSQTYDALKVRFWATLGQEEPEVKVVLG
jgi:hypothetical protein